jgi:hypothetical protein
MGGLPKEMLPQGTELVIGSLGGQLGSGRASAA